MKQITEDYCSYEIAKLLKEKGFKNEYCDNMLLAEDGDTIWKFATFTNRDDAFDATMKFKKQIPYVTHQMALKWLREVHNQNVTVKAHNNVARLKTIYYAEVQNLLNLTEKDFSVNGCTFKDTYEQAVEAALKYTLENLV